jgi:PHD/YefM family antitoxin component YafN of YafNO toxin-antitoxin module
MKKYILITLAFIFLLSGVCFSQSSIGKRFRKNYAYKSFNKPYVSYTLERIHYSKKDTNTFHTNVYINRNNKEPILYTVSNSEYAMRLTYNDFTWINSTTEEIMYYLAPKKKEPSMYQGMLSTLYSHLSKDLCAFSFIDDDRDIRIQRIIKDTIIESKRYDILFGKTCTFISTNHKGESTKYYNEIEILFNKEIDFIESVKWQEMKLDGTPMYDKDEYAICRYTNLSFENKDTEFVNIFNENNPVYTIFEHCNDTNPSKAYVVKGKEFTVLTNEILEWNLINSDKDTKK